MGEDGDIFFSEWDRNYRYRTSYGDYIVPASTFSDMFERFNLDDLYTERTKEDRQYEARTKKFDEILYDVLLDFTGSGLKLVHSSKLLGSKLVIDKIIIEGNNKKTTIYYDPDTHEINGFVWMSLGDRDLTEATEEEVGIIRRALLIWIYENI